MRLTYSVNETVAMFSQETESKWMYYSSSDHLAIMKEVFPMTVKGISLTCLGDVFDNEDELDKLSVAYHKCWREMEVKSLTNCVSV